MHYSSCRWLPVSLRQFVVIGCSSLTQFTYMHIVMHRLTRLHVSLNKISVQLCTVQSKQSAMAAATHRVRDGHPSITMGPGIGWYMHPAPQRNTRYVRMAECGGTYGLLVTHTSTLRETWFIATNSSGHPDAFIPSHCWTDAGHYPSSDRCWPLP